MKKKYLIIAYACEDKGSEPGVGYYWSKTISDVNKKGKTIVITRKNNDISKLSKDSGIEKIGIDLPINLLFIKKIIGIEFYYFLWTLMVFIYLLKNIRKYIKFTVHHITFTPVYYPPIYFILPLKFFWGPIGGAESFPLAYLKSMKFKDVIKETFRSVLKYSSYINPIFYLACVNSRKIICSTKETADFIPRIFQEKVIIELMVMDFDKVIVKTKRNKNIIIANRLINWKMTHLFVESFHEYITNNICDYKLNIIGQGPYFDKIDSFIDNKQIVHFKRFEHRTEMLTMLKESSLFVSMSLRDSGAASLLEAISYHIPFLITDSGAHKSFLDKGVGFGFALENFTNDKEKIILLLSKILNEDFLEKEKEKVKAVYHDHYREKEKYKRIKLIIEGRSLN